MSFFRKLFTRVRGTQAAPQENEAADRTSAATVPEPSAAPQVEEPAATPLSTPEPAEAFAAAPLSGEPVPSEPAATVAPRRKWLERLKHGMSKSSKSLTSGIADIFTKRRLDAATLEELEEVLIRADLGPATARRIATAVGEGRYDREIDPEEVKRILAVEVAKVLAPAEIAFSFDDARKPFVILVVGVNGSGKTTTIGKLGAIARREGFSVSLAACDTFRAAAIEQLSVWADRIGGRLISRSSGADAAGLAFDALKASREDGTDVLIIDTAGRLHNKANLMAELEKIVRVLKKLDPDAPHATLLVLDATTGQNALAQVEIFHRIAAVTGLIMTKLDGTARGGILVAIAEKFDLPVHAIGVGEGIDDLQPFAAEAFSRAIAGLTLEAA
jgi:fused signal recognition particle receptor